MSDITLFSFIGGTVTNAIDAFVTPAASNLMFQLQMVAITGVTLHFVLLGYQIIAGALQDTIVSVMKHSMKVIFVAAFALSAEGYQTHVVDTLQGLETGLSDALSATAIGSTGSASSIYDTLDQVLNEGFLLATACLAQGNEAGWNLGAALGWFSSALLIALGTLVFALAGGVNIIIAKFSLAIMFALGPLFILCLMFPVTAKFFDSWFSQVLNYILTIVVLAVIMVFGIAGFTHFVGEVDLLSGVQNPFIASTQIFGLTLGLTWIALQASGISSGLAGGISMSVLSLRQITKPAITAGRVVNAPSTRRDMQSGMMVTAGRMNHLVAGNTVWNPAYRQHVMQNVGKHWGRAKGGTVGH